MLKKEVIPEQPRPLPDGALYFVGVGGAGMSALAQVLAERGRVVAGSDPGISVAVRARLEAAGVTVFGQHEASQLGDAAVVIVSDAVPEQNPEVRLAREKGIPIFRRPELLGALLNAGRGIAIAGTHGKTTTTGMVASILLAAGLDPTIFLGGDLPLIGGNARAGKSDIVLAESCEAYDGFLYLHPEIAVVLNVEADHLDYHGTEENVFRSLERFLEQVRPGGTVVICADDNKSVARLPRYEDYDVRFETEEQEWEFNSGEGEKYTAFAEACDHYYSNRQVIRYGINHRMSTADLSAVDIDVSGPTPSFTIRYKNSDLTPRVNLRVPGLHNIRNALAAVGVAFSLGLFTEVVVTGLESFTGTGRRFERIGEANDIMVVDDYAHHPTEIRATLAAVRSAYPERRIVAVFQPHLPSRTRDLMDEFAEALTAADAVYITDIYLARELPLPGISSETLAEKARVAKPGLTVTYVPDKNDLPARLAEDIRAGDLVLTMGAGDIRAAGEGLFAGLT